MSDGVRYPRSSQELVARLIKSGYLQPALRNDPDAITTAIARLKEDLRRPNVVGTKDIDCTYRCCGTEGPLVVVSCCVPEPLAAGRGRGFGTCDSVVPAVRTVAS
jgi:hypothetical protein